MQRDALERLNLRQLLMEPELLATVEPDVHLVSQLVSLSARCRRRPATPPASVIRKVVDELERRLAEATRAGRSPGRITRADVTRRPRPATSTGTARSARTCATTSPSTGRSSPRRCSGTGAGTSSLRDVIVAIDQSGSMAASVVYQLGVRGRDGARSGRSRRSSSRSTPRSSTSRTS